MRVVREIYDSNAYQFVGGEIVKSGRGVAEFNPRASSIFSRATLLEWKRKADALNREGDGDQVAFVLEPT
jgi:hypothetical protein